MKKILIAFYFILLMSSVSVWPQQAIDTVVDEKPAEEAPFDFRKTRWGMTREDVMKAEGPADDTVAVSDSLIYTRQLLGKDVRLTYMFTNSTLVGSSYLFLTVHEKNTDYMTVYEEISEALKKKYGYPRENNIIWHNDYFKEDPDSYGIALGIGHLAFSSRWESVKTKVLSTLEGENGEIRHMIEYRSVEYESFKKQEHEKAIMDDL
ncbi:hypothetical protein ACFL47_04550 [Candidatus Latescibacterota bacterium]